MTNRYIFKIFENVHLVPSSTTNLYSNMFTIKWSLIKSKATYCQVWHPVFHPSIPHSERIEPSPTNCLLTSRHTQRDTHTQIEIDREGGSKRKREREQGEVPVLLRDLGGVILSLHRDQDYWGSQWQHWSLWAPRARSQAGPHGPKYWMNIEGGGGGYLCVNWLLSLD